MAKQYSPEIVIARVTGCCATEAERLAKKLGARAAELPAMYLASKGPEIREMLATAGVEAEPSQAEPVEKPRNSRAKKE